MSNRAEQELFSRLSYVPLANQQFIYYNIEIPNDIFKDIFTK